MLSTLLTCLFQPFTPEKIDKSPSVDFSDSSGGKQAAPQISIQKLVHQFSTSRTEMGGEEEGGTEQGGDPPDKPLRQRQQGWQQRQSLLLLFFFPVLYTPSNAA